MKTEALFEEQLKKMMSTTPLDEISVLTLSKRCGVSRKTFYYHFHDIYDLLTLVFLDEKVVDKISNITNVKGLIEAIYGYYDKNKAFVDAAVSSAGKDLFEEFIYNFSNQVILNNFLLNIEESKKLALNEKKNISRFFAHGYASAIVFYLLTHKNKNLEGMRSSLSFINDDSFKEAISSMLKEKK